MLGTVVSGLYTGGELRKETNDGLMYVQTPSNKKVFLDRTTVSDCTNNISPEGIKQLIVTWKTGQMSIIALGAAPARPGGALHPILEPAPVSEEGKPAYPPAQMAEPRQEFAPAMAPVRPAAAPFFHKTSLKILGIILGIIALILAVNLFSMDVGFREYNESYGGDAYTGIQNAAAQTANNIQDLAKIVRYGFGSLLSILGGTLLAGSLCINTKD